MKSINLHYLFRSGKKPKLIYYAKNYLRMLVPGWWYRVRCGRTLDSLYKRPDKEYILRRVSYYNKLDTYDKRKFEASAQELSEHKIPRKQKVYFFDTHEYTRWFPSHLRWGYEPGDIIHVPAIPSIVKSRPLVADNANSVLLKLDKVRHFLFVNDPIPFTEKADRAIFRGKVLDKPIRIRLMEKYFGHPMCDLGDVGRHPRVAAWKVNKLTIHEHLRYKFILAIEGNDVASNLKWVMSSNSIAVMPRPTCETWFMEGTLIPNYHYIEIKEDLSDLEERLRYYIAHPDEARAIIQHAHEYVSQFKDPAREHLISLLVLRKYFEKTEQLAAIGSPR